MVTAPARPSFFARWLPNGEAVLLGVIAVEVAFFAIAGTNFLTPRNGFEIVRLASEIGLLAFGLTAVIKTGGIDLSVGSMMALAAVTLGAAWSAWGWPVWLAVILALMVGAAGGALNGWLVTRLRVPPLIVTLGTFSLFRGIAEATTGGYQTYTGFPDSFLALGQGYLAGWLPFQLVPVLAVFVALWVWLHRTVEGRELTAIGFNPEGARYAGIHVNRLTFRTYLISGVCAALAGVIYVARLGQAKADAGLGAELTAIAAVVLGGTAITGGRGTLHGSLLGLVALVILQNGLRLAGQPGEVAGLCTGLILIGAIAAHLRWSRAPLVSPPPSAFTMKNSQVALIIAAILVGALLIAGSNFFLARSLTSGGAGVAARTA
ncbi:MAG TPA: ABC transporter permease, partial [Candidatus Synoicihabitans sp.]|nr:ABC transporter permease [Candidatus Synoicihabitans sp.]